MKFCELDQHMAPKAGGAYLAQVGGMVRLWGCLQCLRRASMAADKQAAERSAIRQAAQRMQEA